MENSNFKEEHTHYDCRYASRVKGRRIGKFSIDFTSSPLVISAV